jgi:hypothetical protein
MKKFCLLLGFVCVLIFGCSGGGSGHGGNGSGSSQVASTLTVTSITPANGAGDVPVDTTLSIIFNHAVTSSSVLITLSGNGSNVGGTVGVSGSSVTFNPTNNLSPDTVYTVTIGSGTQDTSGNSLQGNYTWSFTTGSTSCIENDTENAYAPQIAMNASGLMVAVWEQADGMTTSIYANQYVPGFGWGQAQVIETLFGDAHSPQVAMDINGNATVVWYQFDGTAYSIYTNRYVPGTGWGAAALIEAAAGNAFNPQVAVDANGNAMAVWYQYAGGYYSIYANRYVIGTGWGAAALTEAANGYAADPQVVMDRNGNAIAVWRQHDGTANSIYYNRYVLGTGWGAAGTLLEATNGSADRPQVSIDDNGNAIFVWEQFDGTANSIYANRYVNGVGVGAAAAIEAAAGPARTAQVCMDANGNAFAVWSQNDGTNWKTYANRYIAGSGWGAATLIQSGTGQASNPQVAADAFGNAVAVWEQVESGVSTICSRRYINGTGWEANPEVESLIGNAYDPQVAMNGHGSVMAIWRNEDSPSSGNYSIFADIIQ